MNRPIAMALAAVLAAGAAWLVLRDPEPVPVSTDPSPVVPAVIAAALPDESAPLLVESEPAPAPPSLPTVAAAQATAQASSDAGAYDDSPLYRVETSTAALPPTPQGLLEAFARTRPATGACLEQARSTNGSLTRLQTLEVRVAAQEDGTAAIEEIRLPASNDPALAFRGCLVAALAAERFELPAQGFVRLTLPVELAP